MPFKDKTPKRSKIPLVIACCLFLVLTGLVFAFVHFHSHGSDLPVAAKPKQQINKQPATSEEKTASQDSKDQIVERNKTTPASSGGVIVTPIITHSEVRADQIEAEAYVSSVVEDTGTCTLRATQGSSTVTKSVGAIANATTTNCQAFIIARSEFPSSGVWSLTVTYESVKAHGTSSATNITL